MTFQQVIGLPERHLSYKSVLRHKEVYVAAVRLHAVELMIVKSCLRFGWGRQILNKTFNTYQKCISISNVDALLRSMSVVQKVWS
jgi:hypothetical protein